MDILKEIKKEHNEFRDLIREIEHSDGDERQEKFVDLYSKIKGHHQAEEKIVFPYVANKARLEDQETVLEMVEEHKLGSYQLSLLDRTSFESESWDAKFSVLKEVLTHHMDEEEDKFFKLADFHLTEKERESLYEDFEAEMEEAESLERERILKKDK